MFYFRISVSPTTYSESHQEYFESTAHIFVEAENIEKAAVDVVKKIQSEKWRIVDVLSARHLHPDERFWSDQFLAQAFREAQTNSYAYFVESAPAQTGPVTYAFEAEPSASLDQIATADAPHRAN